LEGPHSGFATEEYRQLSTFFTLIDKDGDRVLSKSEVQAAAGALGLTATQRDLTNVMLKVDADKSDTLNLQEFLLLVKSMLQGNAGEKRAHEAILKAANSLSTGASLLEGPHSGFATEEITQFSTYFTAVDKDGDQVLSKSELQAAAKSLGLTAAQSNLNDVMLTADADKSDTLSFQEFLMLMKSTLNSTTADSDVQEAFAVYDRDGNGKIDATELSLAEAALGSPITQEEVSEMILGADDDLDGHINFEEFPGMLLAK